MAKILNGSTSARMRPEPGTDDIKMQLSSHLIKHDLERDRLHEVSSRASTSFGILTGLRQANLGYGESWLKASHTQLNLIIKFIDISSETLLCYTYKLRKCRIFRLRQEGENHLKYHLQPQRRPESSLARCLTLALQHPLEQHGSQRLTCETKRKWMQQISLWA